MIHICKHLRNDPCKTTGVIVFARRSKTTTSSDDYQYLQRSSVPTLHFQKSLPRLPIPNLPQTCERYLKSLKPLLDSSAFSHTTEIVNKFQATDGLALHEELMNQDKQNKHTSYISEPWSHMYLSDRTPLPINYNPILIYTQQNNSFYDKQLVKISNLIISSLRFYKSLKENKLEPEVFHLNPKKSDTKLFRTVTGFLPSAVSWYGAYMFNAYPLDMIQYSHLFSNTRIPEKGKDRLLHSEDQKHILVLRNGNFYSVDVLDNNGNILSPEIIFSSINHILNDTSGAAEFPLGIFTSLNRDQWAEIRKYLEKLGNQESLSVIDRSLFVVALDGDVSDNPARIVQSFLHSDGTNRWFDKSFTLISASNGYVGINFEHSWGDGVAVLRYFEDIYKDSTKAPKITESIETIELSSDKIPKKLQFVLDEKAKQDVNNAKSSFQKVYESLDLKDTLFELGRNLCKQHNVSPDAVMQLAFQLAYYNLTKTSAATYESCSTAAFKHGRTETVRPCTLETKKFCESVTKASNEELLKMIVECSKAHSNLVKNAAMGQGFDRHLFALRKLAEKKSSILPEIYTDKSYQLINHNILSTSTLSSDIVLAGGFGPVVPNGYGIAYMIRKDECGAVVTNYKNNTDGNAFKSCLLDSLKTIRSVLKSKN